MDGPSIETAACVPNAHFYAGWSSSTRRQNAILHECKEMVCLLSRRDASAVIVVARKRPLSNPWEQCFAKIPEVPDAIDYTLLSLFAIISVYAMNDVADTKIAAFFVICLPFFRPHAFCTRSSPLTLWPHLAEKGSLFPEAWRLFPETKTQSSTPHTCLFMLEKTQRIRSAIIA